jgi:hypothetical protein
MQTLFTTMSDLPSYSDQSFITCIVFKYFKIKLYNAKNYVSKLSSHEYLDKMATDKSRKKLDETYDMNLNKTYQADDVFELDNYESLTLEGCVNEDDFLVIRDDSFGPNIDTMLVDTDHKCVVICAEPFYHHFDYVGENMDKTDILCTDMVDVKRDMKKVEDLLEIMGRLLETVEDWKKEKLVLLSRIEKLERCNDIININKCRLSNFIENKYNSYESCYILYSKKDDIYLHDVIAPNDNLKSIPDSIDNHHSKTIVINKYDFTYSMDNIKYHDSFYRLIFQIVDIVKSKKPYKFMTDIYFNYYIRTSNTIHDSIFPKHYEEALPYLKEFATNYSHITVHIIGLPESKIINIYSHSSGQNGFQRYSICDITSILSLFKWTDKL